MRRILTLLAAAALLGPLALTPARADEPPPAPIAEVEAPHPDPAVFIETEVGPEPEQAVEGDAIDAPEEAVGEIAEPVDPPVDPPLGEPEAEADCILVAPWDGDNHLQADDDCNGTPNVCEGLTVADYDATVSRGHGRFGDYCVPTEGGSLLLPPTASCFATDDNWDDYDCDGTPDYYRVT